MQQNRSDGRKENKIYKIASRVYEMIIAQSNTVEVINNN